MDDTTVATALAEIDRRHGQDPEGGEQGYARRMTAVLDALVHDASAELRIAVRAQHFERWTTPRNAYPEGRRGYLAWRRDAAEVQARKIVALLADLKFSKPFAARVEALMLKSGLKRDPEVQTLEDCACLVFLEFQFADFKTGRDRAQLINIVRRTWAKMSTDARCRALKLPLAEPDRKLIEEAL
jgi:hypothetical protein